MNWRLSGVQIRLIFCEFEAWCWFFDADPFFVEFEKEDYLFIVVNLVFDEVWNSCAPFPSVKWENGNQCHACALKLH